MSSIPISDGVLNNRLNITKDLVDWSEVVLPDGRVGFIEKQDIELMTQDKDLRDQTSIVISIALSMKGVPYLWGGNSVNGNDCSGFIHNIYENSGINLPRDARQQAELGKLIIPNNNWSNVKPGDLLFFGKENKITHVGMSTGGKEFIHQGGMVKVNSLDSSSNKFAPKRNETFQFIKRLN